MCRRCSWEIIFFFAPPAHLPHATIIIASRCLLVESRATCEAARLVDTQYVVCFASCTAASIFNGQRSGVTRASPQATAVPGDVALAPDLIIVSSCLRHRASLPGSPLSSARVHLRSAPKSWSRVEPPASQVPSSSFSCAPLRAADHWWCVAGC
eukprot:GGOE01011711.1.p3 GENE.GGOE01011711.1~~GGOE01011711.1.p3  ORF type:complete len:154 (-),score=7.41 GGOE01011711.1:338-799(-)